MEFITYTKSLDASDFLKYNIFVSPTTKICEGVKLYSGVKVYGESNIGEGVELHSNVEINNCNIGDFCQIFCGSFRECEIGKNCTIKSFAHITNTQVGDDCEIGNFVCVNDSVIGAHAKIYCLVNLSRIDAGNYLKINSGVCCESDSEDNITIGDNVELGTNTTIIKPVVIADNTKTKANSVIVKDILD